MVFSKHLTHGAAKPSLGVHIPTQYKLECVYTNPTDTYRKLCLPLPLISLSLTLLNENFDAKA